MGKYTKTPWVDRLVQYANRFLDELGNTKTFTPSPGTITEAGTDVNAANLNKIEQGLEDANNELSPESATLSHGIQVLNTDQASGLNVLARGNTLVNILADLGNGESLTGWTVVGTVATSTTQKKSGSNSFKCTSTGSPSYGYVDMTYPLDTAKYYIVGGWVYIESYTAGSVAISIRDVGTLTLRYEALAVAATVGSRQFVYVKIPTSNTLVGTGFRAVVGLTSTPTSVAYFDDIRIYEVTADLYNAIGTTYTASTYPSIDDILPYVDGMQSVTYPWVEVVADNFCPTDPGEWEQGTISTSGVEQSDTARIRLIDYFNVSPSTEYTFSLNNTYDFILYEYTEDNVFVQLSGGASTWTTTESRTFTTGSTTRKMRVAIRHSDNVTIMYPNTILTVEPQLIPSATAPDFFQPYHRSLLVGTKDSNGDALKLHGVSDVYDVWYDRDKVLRRWREHVLESGDLFSYNTSASVNFDIIQIYKPTDSSSYNNSTAQSGQTLLEGYGYGAYVDSTSMIGKLFTSTTTLYGVAVAKGTYANLAAAQAALAGTKLLYQLATEETEIITAIGGLDLGRYNHVTVGEGLVVREVATPVSNGSTYFVNDTGQAGSELDYRTLKILEIYKNGDIDTSWTISQSGSIYGIEKATIPVADFDTTAIYTVDYLALDRYLLTAPLVTVTATYQGNVGSVVAQSAKAISDLQYDVSSQGDRLSEAEVTIIDRAKAKDAGGTGTAITLTVENYTAYLDKSMVTFIAAANNSGSATTLNINSIGAKSLYKPNTTDAPNIIAGKAYTVWYDEGDDAFFWQASAVGTAVAGDVLAGETFSNDSESEIVGDMPNRSGDTAALSSTFSGTTLKLLASNGYRDGVDDYVTITDADFDGASILSTKEIFGKTGTFPSLSAGDVPLYRISGESWTFPSTYTKVKDIDVNFTGTYRVKFTIPGHTSNNYYGRIYKNGVAFGTERINATSGGVEYTEDLSFSAGDNIQLYVKITTGTGSATTTAFSVNVATHPLLTIVL